MIAPTLPGGSMAMNPLEVPADQLRWNCDPECFSFQCTDELVPLQEFIGQERAISAIEFGLGVDQPGYNIFVGGMTGTGKSSVVKAHLEQVVAKRKLPTDQAPPPDWCYVHNFSDTDRPKIISMSAGTGKRFRSRMERLRDDLQHDVVAAFTNEEYEAQRKAIAEENQNSQRRLFQELEVEAQAKGLTVQLSPVGVTLVPVVDGRTASQEEFVQLPEATRRQLDESRQELMGRVDETISKIRALDREAGERLSGLDKQVAEFVAGGRFERERDEFADFPEVLGFLDDLRAFAVEHIDAFRGEQGEQQSQPQSNPFREASLAAREREVLLPFVVNVFVDNTGADGPPIIVENNPTFSNLFGKIDRRFVLGGYVTDHSLLKAGSISQANGGYLVLNLRNLVTSPLAWETLKRVVRDKEVRPEDPAEVMGMVVPQSIKPEPMPLEVKIVVTGETDLYNMLSSFDEEFWETFKVKADFDSQIQRNEEHLDAYAAFICGACNTHMLRHFSRDGVGAVIEYAARLVADQRKLTTRFGLVRDLLIEADYWAGKDQKDRVDAIHVKKALEQKEFRSDLISERLREMIVDGSLLVDVTGEVVGQVNGLAVFDVGGYAFGKPARITAKTYLGSGGVINIEREAKLSGSTHDKGVLILSGYLGSKYAQDRPLSVSASIAFEQSYSGVDGDSASSTEIYAILSSLSGLSLKQGLAVTGSVNQNGQVQPIGGVNQKIEGFFEVCRAKGLTGDQGVLVPKQNVVNLMLRDDVVEAVRDGAFHVYAVETIGEGIELLTGTPAGVPDDQGAYPEGSVNDLVVRQLTSYAEARRAFAAQGASENGATPLSGVDEPEKAPAKRPE
jgi:predicted ATP-dependent protease